MDLNASIPLSLPGTVVPELVELGFVSGGTGTAITTNFRSEGGNVLFEIRLGSLNPPQLQGLAKLLAAHKGAGAQMG